MKYSVKWKINQGLDSYYESEIVLANPLNWFVIGLMKMSTINFFCVKKKSTLVSVAIRCSSLVKLTIIIHVPFLTVYEAVPSPSEIGRQIICQAWAISLE